MESSLPVLSASQLEILHQALDPRLDGFGQGDSCLDDASAFLARLALSDGSESGNLKVLVKWLNTWKEKGGNRATLLLAVEALLSQTQQQHKPQDIELVWSGPDWGAGAQMRDQSVLIQQLVEQAKRRLLLTTYAFYKGPFIEKLFQLIKTRMIECPDLEVRMVCNITRQKKDNSLPEALVNKFRDTTWKKLWKPLPNERTPSLFYDPRSVHLDATAVCHVKAVVSDDQLLVTSANLTDAAQLENFELGIHLHGRHHAQTTWEHFDQLIKKGALLKLNSGSIISCALTRPEPWPT
jgi:phosphatidylserine/phosphatidylglycerophosphate/cardiolipin synthase-like enzyme